MKKITLRPMETNNYEMIKELVDHDANKKRAALKIQLYIEDWCYVKFQNILNVRYLYITEYATSLTISLLAIMLFTFFSQYSSLYSSGD